MYYLLLGVAVLGITANFSLNKVYQMHAPTTFGVIMRKTIPLVLLQGLMFAALSGFSLTVTPLTFALSLIMAILTIAGAVYIFVGYSTGDMVIFTLFQMAGGMLLPFIYGIFYGNKVTPCRIIGMVLMLISIILPFLPSFRGGTVPEKQKTRPKVLFFLMCAAIFFNNGANSIVSYIHANSAATADADSFLILKSLLTGALGLVIYVVYRLALPVGRTDRMRDGIRLRSLWLPALLILLMVAADGLSYRLMLLSAAHLPAVAQYPMVTGGTVIATALAGRLFFREKITPPTAFSLLLTLLATILFIF